MSMLTFHNRAGSKLPAERRRDAGEGRTAQAVWLVGAPVARRG